MNKNITTILLILSGICWGGSGVFVRTLNIAGLNNITIVSTKIIVATFILFIGLLIFNKDAFKIKLKDFWIFIAMSLTGIILLSLFYNEAVFSLTLSLASVLLNLSFIFSMLFSIILFKEKITFGKMICLILALFGCVLVSGVFDSSITHFSTLGIIFGVLCAISWALYGIFARISTNKGYTIYTTIFYNFLIASIILIPFTNWSTFATFIVKDPVINGSIALSHSIFTSILPNVLFITSLKYVENGRATVISSSIGPIAALVFGLIIYYEIPTYVNLFGIILTIIALATLVKIKE